MSEPVKSATDQSSANVPMEEFWQQQPQSDELALHVDVDGFEGPMDLLLHLARTQKVDLTQISVLALAEQYLTFVELARDRKLELAADYLVMAAWLAYLKSRLLIPKMRDEDGETGEQLAAVLQFRLKRLEAMRDAAGRLINRDRLGRDVFVRGMPEIVVVEKTSLFTASLYDLLTAYASQRQRQAVSQVQIARRTVWSLKESRVLLVRMIGEISDWVALDTFLLDYITRPEDRASAMASSFAASLELVREGRLELSQQAAFQPIYMRRANREREQVMPDEQQLDARKPDAQNDEGSQ